MTNFREFLEKQFKNINKNENDLVFDSFRNLIKEERKKQGLTQQELSELSGLTQAYISNFEAGKYNISLKQLDKILAALKIKVTLEVKSNDK